jgi:hypothetical protein
LDASGQKEDGSPDSNISGSVIRFHNYDFRILAAVKYLATYEILGSHQ